MIIADEFLYTAHFNANDGYVTYLLSGEHFDFGGGSRMDAYSVKYTKVI